MKIHETDSNNEKPNSEIEIPRRPETYRSRNMARVVQ